MKTLAGKCFFIDVNSLNIHIPSYLRCLEYLNGSLTALRWSLNSLKRLIPGPFIMWLQPICPPPTLSHGLLHMLVFLPGTSYSCHHCPLLHVDNPSFFSLSWRSLSGDEASRRGRAVSWFGFWSQRDKLVPLFPITTS